jgi:5-methylcytosine-specific restriction endonuclease McrA
MVGPEVGEKFLAKVDRISGSGNGIIDLTNSHDGKHINLGNISQELVGETIIAAMISENRARVVGETKTEEVQLEYGISREISDTGLQTDHNISTVGNVKFCSCGSVMKKDGEEWICSFCGTKKSQVQSETPESESNSGTSEIKAKSTKENNSLDDLREKAIEDATAEVPEDAITTQTTQQYNRSTDVKKYVKARAGGACEGCGEPAPFENKNGEPYLHAHHIHELSDGGSDTPDTVIALCPNCHYRVHHGKDGEEYNQKLLAKVREIEGIDKE